MTQQEKYKLLKIYVGELQRHEGNNLYHAIMLKLREHGIVGATACRGVEGYGLDKLIKKAGILDLSADLPMLIEAVDTEEKIDAVAPVISQMVNRGMIYMVDVDVIKHG
jgi:PII-like signaling protein